MAKGWFHAFKDSFSFPFEKIFWTTSFQGLHFYLILMPILLLYFSFCTTDKVWAQTTANSFRKVNVHYRKSITYLYFHFLLMIHDHLRVNLQKIALMFSVMAHKYSKSRLSDHNQAGPKVLTITASPQQITDHYS